MSTETADIVVIGGGSGGYAAAIRAAELGKSVVIIEKDKVGGTCLHRGCIPTKALLHAAEVADTARGASAIGVLTTVESIDGDLIQAYRDGIVAKKFKGLEGLLKARGILTVTGTARLEADGTVRVGDTVWNAADVIIATGASSRVLPGIEVGGRILTSDQALERAEIPRHALVLGGGVIGVEFASLWRSLGAEVTIIEGAATLVPTEDPSLSKGLERAFRRRGITSRLGSRFASVSQTADEVTVTLEDGSTLVGDVLLVAVGRQPATGNLGLEEAGVTLDRGFVSVDANLQTTRAHVWAVGDIVAGLQLAHRGFAQGIFVADTIAGVAANLVPDEHVARVTYSHPELASVGLTEPQAREQFGDNVAVTEFNLAGNAKSEIIGTGGLVKVIRETGGPVVGVHLIGDRVGELISEAQLIVGWEAHPEDVTPYLHAHPTQSEALGEALLSLAGKPLHAL